jgi:hypothetical protein
MRIHQALCVAVLAAGFCSGQQNPTPQPDQVAAAAANDAGAVYGTIKDVKAGQKIVIDVEKGKDRTYNLASPRTAVTVSDDLAVGDKVKILESGKKGSKTVQIVRDIRNTTDTQRSRTGTDQK